MDAMTTTTLRQIVEQNNTKWGRVFDFAIQFLIVVSLVTKPPSEETLAKFFPYKK